MTDRTTNEKPDMGYHGSNLHGYSITEKGKALDQTAKAGTKNKENGEEELFVSHRN
ncbi:hypothetical protein [Brevibacillus choshinensis]|uniref:hypothetical protein n=1 Tax=Brevibacillus choshinensis TaxID=54911 RepID=UPI000A9F28D1|nr:hypothetical protein [Brevibacillus choshinensis]